MEEISITAETPTEIGGSSSDVAPSWFSDFEDKMMHRMDRFDRCLKVC